MTDTQQFTPPSQQIDWSRVLYLGAVAFIFGLGGFALLYLATAFVLGPVMGVLTGLFGAACVFGIVALRATS